MYKRALEIILIIQKKMLERNSGTGLETMKNLIALLESLRIHLSPYPPTLLPTHTQTPPITESPGVSLL